MDPLKIVRFPEDAGGNLVSRQAPDRTVEATPGHLDSVLPPRAAQLVFGIGLRVSMPAFASGLRRNSLHCVVDANGARGHRGGWWTAG